MNKVNGRKVAFCPTKHAHSVIFWDGFNDKLVFPYEIMSNNSYKVIWFYFIDIFYAINIRNISAVFTFLFFCRPKSGSSVWNPFKGDASLSAAAGELRWAPTFSKRTMVLKVLGLENPAGLAALSSAADCPSEGRTVNWSGESNIRGGCLAVSVAGCLS